uniref:Uncharacterized protein n=1 Tax=viral metagenome TaxID=1070528 RepID=A0A6M3LSM8_9ZZZZ
MSVLLLCPVVSADIVSLANDVCIWSGYWEDIIHDLLGYLPEKKWVTNSNMGAWVDIVGFNHTIELNGTRYVVGNISNSTIVRYDVDEYLSGSESRWNDNVDWIHKNLTITQNDSHVIATLDITMMWHHSHKRENGKGIKKTYHYSYLTCIDTEPIPLQYNISLDNISANITIYNNTFAPKTYIYIPENDYIIEVGYYYGNRSITHTRSIGDIRYTEKNVPYINITKYNVWKFNNLSKINNYAVVPGDNFSIVKLTVTILTPEGYRIVDHYNVSIVEYDPKNVVYPVFWLVVGSIFVFMGVIYQCVKISF